MKIKLWNFEYDFDKDDAKIVVPIILLFAAILSTNIDPAILISFAAIYYLLYFFLFESVKKLKSVLPKPKLKCPNCTNKKIILQGYQGYNSDEHYAYYWCSECKATSILTNGGMLRVG